MLPKHIIKKAISTAYRSTVIRGSHGAVCFLNNGAILTSAHNTTFLGSERIKTIHAEEAILNKLFKIKAVERYGKDLNILVLRYCKGTKRIANSKPCPSCTKSLLKTPFNIYYSNENGEIVALDRNTINVV